MPLWKGGWPLLLRTRITLVEPEGFLHSTTTVIQTRHVCSTSHCILVTFISVFSADRSTDLCLVVPQALTELYSMPNGAQAPTEEGEASGDESQEEEWDSDAAEADDDDDDDDDGDEDDAEDEEEEEEEVVPPRSERRSKLVHDPATERGKGVATVTQSTKRPRTTSPAPTEKASKQPRAAPSKPTKLLPKMKVSIPTISG